MSVSLGMVVVWHTKHSLSSGINKIFKKNCFSVCSRLYNRFSEHQKSTCLQGFWENLLYRISCRLTDNFCIVPNHSRYSVPMNARCKFVLCNSPIRSFFFQVGGETILSHAIPFYIPKSLLFTTCPSPPRRASTNWANIARVSGASSCLFFPSCV